MPPPFSPPPTPPRPDGEISRLVTHVPGGQASSWIHRLTAGETVRVSGPYGTFVDDTAGMGPVLYMVGTKIAVGILGIVITFAPDAIYDFYAHQGSVWGMSPSTDQQVAGALMAVEQSLIMGTALAWLFVRMLGESQRTDERRERYAPAD